MGFERRVSPERLLERLRPALRHLQRRVRVTLVGLVTLGLGFTVGPIFLLPRLWTEQLEIPALQFLTYTLYLVTPGLFFALLHRSKHLLEGHAYRQLVNGAVAGKVRPSIRYEATGGIPEPLFEHSELGIGKGRKYLTFDLIRRHNKRLCRVIFQGGKSEQHGGLLFTMDGLKHREGSLTWLPRNRAWHTIFSIADGVNYLLDSTRKTGEREVAIDDEGFMADRVAYATTQEAALRFESQALREGLRALVDAHGNGVRVSFVGSRTWVFIPLDAGSRFGPVLPRPRAWEASLLSPGVLAKTLDDFEAILELFSALGTLLGAPEAGRADEASPVEEGTDESES